MNFHYSAFNLDPGERMRQRVFEIIPGAISWFVLLGMTFLAFRKPIAAAAVIIAFDLYWLLRLFYMSIFLLVSYMRLSAEKETDWMKRIRDVDGLEETLRTFRLRPKRPFFDFRNRLSDWIYLRQLKHVRKSGNKLPPSEDIYHLVLVPVAKESKEIVEPGILGLANGIYPSERMVVAVALEARASEQVKKETYHIQKKYKDRFSEFAVVEHPDNLPGEARVKGANVTFAAKEMAQYFRKRKIPFGNVIVSCFDADTVIDPKYFACLTYQFMCCTERNRASFQPIPVYHNNVWEAPGFARVLEMGASFFQLVEATNPEKLVTFSSHSMSFKALVDIGYWPCDMISDDSAIFWKAYIFYDGDYRAIPLFVTLSMDVVNAGSWWKTIVNIYRQKRRWAWGVENFPIVMRAFLISKKISLYNKTRYIFKLLECNVAWATWAFILSVIAWLPPLFAGREFSHSVLYYSAPRISGIVYNLSTLALILTIIISLRLLPKKKLQYPFFKRAMLALQWFFVPVIFTCLSALPALDAQTRLMLGKYMEFWVTEKKRKKLELRFAISRRSDHSG